MRTACEALVLVALLAGCATALGRDLRFEVVAQGQFARDAQAPALGVAVDAEGRARLERAVGRPLPGDVLVAVFQGTQRTGGYSVTVDRVHLEEDTLTVGATFVRPGRDAIVTQVITSPFAVVRVARQDLPMARLHVLLRDADGKVIALEEADLR